jgi:hypothetical protein
VITIPRGQLTLVTGTVGTAEHELIHIEAAAHALLLLRYHSSQAVKLAVDRACDTATARFAWFTTGAALSTGLSIASVILAPIALTVAMPVVLAGGAVLVGSSAAAGWCTAEAVDSGVDLRKKKARCREGELLFQGSTNVYSALTLSACEKQEDISTSIRGFCLILAYLYHKLASLEHLNDETLINRMQEVNECLRGSLTRLDDPVECSRLMVEIGNDLRTDVQELSTILTDLQP